MNSGARRPSDSGHRQQRPSLGAWRSPGVVRCIECVSCRMTLISAACYTIFALSFHRSVFMTQSHTSHIPVMSEEVIAWLRPQPGQTFVDGTLGGGGHTRLLAQHVGSDGDVFAMDRDPTALELAERNLSGLPIKIAQANFCDIQDVLREIGASEVDGVLLDLGISSDQLADDARGFSFHSSGSLDLRFDPEEGEPAWRLLERCSAETLARIFRDFGEERFSKRIAREIVRRRRTAPIRTPSELAEMIRRCTPNRSDNHIHPATRTFQALRIAVNSELESLQMALERLPDCLKTGGRLAIISFHSLEDRIVKNAFRDDPRYGPLTKKPSRPSDEEVARNPRSRSARLRVAARTESNRKREA